MKVTIILTFSVALCCTSAAQGQTVNWTRQLGTDETDGSSGISADGLGNVYVSGSTGGSLGGLSEGSNDVFVSKLDGAGNLVWVRQLGTNLGEQSGGVSAEGLGNVYITGGTQGILDGANAGDSDPFVYDAFVSKFDEDGNLEWTRQLGSKGEDFSNGVSADGLGNVYISGYTSGSLDDSNGVGSDAFVSKYSETGNLLWTRQFGTDAEVVSYGVSADSLGSVFISGLTSSDLPRGRDAFVSKYSDTGTLLWTRQLGTDEYDSSWGVSADGLGNVYISGYTDGNLGGRYAGNHDAFVSKFDTAGNLLWTTQLGTSGQDLSNGVSADGLGNVFFSGGTEGNVGGPNAGGNDAFVVRVGNVPEPSSLLLCSLASLGLMPRQLRSSH